MSRLRTWAAQHPTTRILLLPSVRDAHHVPVFPTPPFHLDGRLHAPAAPTGLSSGAPHEEAGEGGAAMDLDADAPEGGPCLGGGPVDSLPSPCLFEVLAHEACGGVVFGASCADVLRALSGSEQAQGGPPGQDRLGALASHVVGQRR